MIINAVKGDMNARILKRFKTLQCISGAARMEKNAYDCEWLEYWVYDCYDTDNPDIIAIDRWKFLVGNLAQNSNIPIYSVVTDDSINDSISSIKDNLPIDVVSINIREALINLGNITGENVTEDIINKIFSKFFLDKFNS